MFDVVGGRLRGVVGPGVHVSARCDLTFERLVGVAVVGSRGDHVMEQRLERVRHHGLDGEDADGQALPQELIG